MNFRGSRAMNFRGRVQNHEVCKKQEHFGYREIKSLRNIIATKISSFTVCLIILLKRSLNLAMTYISEILLTWH